MLKSIRSFQSPINIDIAFKQVNLAILANSFSFTNYSSMVALPNIPIRFFFLNYSQRTSSHFLYLPSLSPIFYPYFPLPSFLFSPNSLASSAEHLIFLKKYERTFVCKKYQWSCAFLFQEERTQSYGTQIKMDKMDKKQGIYKAIACFQKKSNGYVTSTFHVCQCCLICMNHKNNHLFIQYRNLLILVSISGNIQYPWFFHCYIPQGKLLDMDAPSLNPMVFWVQPLPRAAILIQYYPRQMALTLCLENL